MAHSACLRGTRPTRVEYDDGDMGWVVDVNNKEMCKILGEARGSGGVPLMAAVATSVDEHASARKAELGAEDGDRTRGTSAVSFNPEPSAELPAAE